MVNVNNIFYIKIKENGGSHKLPKMAMRGKIAPRFPGTLFV
jgi:hypothetical protein